MILAQSTGLDGRVSDLAETGGVGTITVVVVIACIISALLAITYCVERLWKNVLGPALVTRGASDEAQVQVTSNLADTARSLEVSSANLQATQKLAAENHEFIKAQTTELRTLIALQQK